MAARSGYDVVVDVDAEGDLGHTDLQEDLEFHPSNFDDSSGTKIAPDTNPNLTASNKTGTGNRNGNGSTFLSAANSSIPGPSSSSSASSKRYLWTLSFYAQFFDVDTAEVLRRGRAALYPRANFLDVLDGNPDLYGPFWIATTVVMILFLTGTISQYLAHRSGDEEAKQKFAYNFRLLSGAAGLIYGYTGIIPVALWGALKWFGNESANILECWALYGYANLIWIPVALISWSPILILNYVFVAIGFGVSALFLFRNLYPILSGTDVKTSKILLIAVVALHAGLAIAITVLFFVHSSPVTKKKQEAPAEGDPQF